MLEAQTQVYDFVTPDVLLTSQLETEHPEQECSYWAILQQRDSGKVRHVARVERTMTIFTSRRGGLSLSRVVRLIMRFVNVVPGDRALRCG